MKGDTIISLNTLEIDLLILILDEISNEHKIPNIIDETIRQELFAELDIAKILTDLKLKLGKDKFEQLEDADSEQLYIVKLTETEIYDLKNGDYGDIEPIIDEILEQVKKQTEEA